MATLEHEPSNGNWWDKIIKRRPLLIAAGAGSGILLADRIGLLGFLHPESEKRKKGLKLENLEFNTQDGKKLEKDRIYRVGKIDLQKQTTNYDLILNPQQLIHIADRCGINQIPEVFQIIISEQYLIPNQQEQFEEMEARASSDGSVITIFIGLDTLFKNAANRLSKDFEVSAEKKSQAEANFNILTLSRTIMNMLCGATISSNLDRKRASRQEAERALEKANQIADAFRDEMLNDHIAPAIIVYPSPGSII